MNVAAFFYGLFSFFNFSELSDVSDLENSFSRSKCVKHFKQFSELEKTLDSLLKEYRVFITDMDDKIFLRREILVIAQKNLIKNKDCASRHACCKAISFMACKQALSKNFDFKNNLNTETLFNLKKCVKAALVKDFSSIKLSHELESLWIAVLFSTACSKCPDEFVESVFSSDQDLDLFIQKSLEN